MHSGAFHSLQAQRTHRTTQTPMKAPTLEFSGQTKYTDIRVHMDNGDISNQPNAFTRDELEAQMEALANAHKTRIQVEYKVYGSPRAVFSPGEPAQLPYTFGMGNATIETGSPNPQERYYDTTEADAAIEAFLRARNAPVNIDTFIEEGGLPDEDDYFMAG